MAPFGNPFWTFWGSCVQPGPASSFCLLPLCSSLSLSDRCGFWTLCTGASWVPPPSAPCSAFCYQHIAQVSLGGPRQSLTKYCQICSLPAAAWCRPPSSSCRTNILFTPSWFDIPSHLSDPFLPVWSSLASPSYCGATGLHPTCFSLLAQLGFCQSFLPALLKIVVN